MKFCKTFGGYFTKFGGPNVIFCTIYRGKLKGFSVALDEAGWHSMSAATAVSECSSGIHRVLPGPPLSVAFCISGIISHVFSFFLHSYPSTSEPISPKLYFSIF